MESDDTLNLMALARNLEPVMNGYRHWTARALRTATDSPENETAKENGRRYLREMDQTVRRWAAANPLPSAPAQPVEWTDGDRLMEAIAAAIQGTDYDLPVEQVHDIAAAVAGPARRVAHHEAADRIHTLPQDYELDPGRGESANNLRQWVCLRCQGSGIDPEDSSPGEIHGDHPEPPALEPCRDCQFTEGVRSWR